MHANVARFSAVAAGIVANRQEIASSRIKAIAIVAARPWILLTFLPTILVFNIFWFSSSHIMLLSR
jgi:hypothetical protein